MKLTKIALATAAGAVVFGTAALSSLGAASAAPAKAPAKAAPASLVSSTGTVVNAASTSASSGKLGAGLGHNGFTPKAALGTTVKPASKPNSVIGADSRYLVSNTTSFPNAAIVLIKRNGAAWCTGYLISKDTLVSAGHCVTNGAGTWYSGLSFSPGSNGGNAPFGTYYSRATYAFSAWASGANSNYDGSIIKLNGTPGYSTGWFGTWWQTASLNGLSTTVEGYPGDKPMTEWVSYDYVRSSTADRISYQNDTIGGESGSPVFQYRYNQSFCNGYCVMGIHTNGVDSTGNNSGTRFTQAKLTTIYNIANQA